MIDKEIFSNVNQRGAGSGGCSDGEDVERDTSSSRHSRLNWLVGMFRRIAVAGSKIDDSKSSGLNFRRYSVRDMILKNPVQLT